MNSTKKVIVSVSSDLCTDQRVQKVCASLVKEGYKVSLVGRKLKESPEFVNKNYASKRFSLWFNKGALFYANLNIRLFFFLIFSRAKVFYANDLDTLPANFLAAKIKRVGLVYDSHEYFTEVPELVNRPKVQRIWEKIEQLIVPKLKYCITVAENISRTYNKKYGVPFTLVRNFPIFRSVEIPEKENYIIYQGALNVGRGLEELIAAMPNVNAKLWIAGGGDIENELIQKVLELELDNKIIFLGRLAPKELKKYTLRAKIGVSIEKDMGLNYRYALPNKVFDYLHNGTVILYSNLLEVKVLLGDKIVGEELISYDSAGFSKQLNSMLESEKLGEWRQNAKILAEKYNWQVEEQKLLELVNLAAND